MAEEAEVGHDDEVLYEQILRAARPLALLVAVCAVAAAGCAPADEVAGIAGAAQPVDDPFAGGYPMYEDRESGLRVVFGTPDLGAGRTRVAFALLDEDGIISEPSVVVRSYFYADGPSGSGEGPLEEATLRYGAFPLGARGLYRGHLDLGQPGLWALEVDVTRSDGRNATLLFPVEVAAEPRAPDIGERAPESEHRTLADVDSIAELTTQWAPNEALYQESIAGARAARRPFVVVFASPAFCTTALCGPQDEVLGELAAEYAGRAAFIHVDLYENPHEIRGDLERAVRSPLLEEWGITTDQWTFVVGSDGRVVARFEGFAPRDELEPALLQAIGGS